MKLLERKARGIALSTAGRVFLHHAPASTITSRNGWGGRTSRGAARKTCLAIGFLAGVELVWLSEAMRILREEARDIEIRISSHSCPELTAGLMQGKVDVALLRREAQTTGLALKFLMKEQLFAILQATHRLAARKAVRPQDLAREILSAQRTLHLYSSL